MTYIDMFMIKVLKWLTCVVVPVVLAALLSMAGAPMAQHDQVHQQSTITASVVAIGDLRGEPWWTTTDCPAGVPAPCLDPAAQGAGPIPARVQDEMDRLIDAQWVCLDRLGLPLSDRGVRVSGEVLHLCRSFAYLAVARDQHPGSR